MTKHKLCPAPPPRCIHVYAQGWACPREVVSNGLCRVHGAHLSHGLSLVADEPDASEDDANPIEPMPADDATAPAHIVAGEGVALTIASDERAAIALLTLFASRCDEPEVEGVPLGHAVTLAKQFLSRTRRPA